MPGFAMSTSLLSLSHATLPIRNIPAPKFYSPHHCYSKIKLAITKTPPFSLEQIPPNALRKKLDPSWRGGFSLGVDLGQSRTGVAVSKGFVVRPLTIVELRGQKLELRLLQLAEQQEADEFIIGLPLSSDGKETQQSSKVRSVAGRFAVRAAERGWRVYLQDEYGTSTDAMSHMINSGVGKSNRHRRIDAYAAMMVLERYFAMSGDGVELVLPKQLELQEKLRIGRSPCWLSPPTTTRGC